MRIVEAILNFMGSFVLSPYVVFGGPSILNIIKVLESRFLLTSSAFRLTSHMHGDVHYRKNGLTSSHAFYLNCSGSGGLGERTYFQVTIHRFLEKLTRGSNLNN